MGIHGVLLSQDTVDNLEDIFTNDKLAVEEVDLTDDDRAHGGVRILRLTSDKGGKVRLEIIKDERNQPDGRVCTVHFDAGFALSRSHDKLYWRVVKRLRELHAEPEK